jgi:DNA-binding transcriptional MerR regulator
VVSFNIEEIQKLITENVKITLTKFMCDSTDHFEDVDHQIKTLDKRMTEKLSNLVPTNKYESS